MSVLYLGCGPGVTTRALAESVTPGAVVGVDLSATLLEEATRVLAADPISNLRFQRGSAYDLDLAEATFDFVYARLLFQHLTDPPRALQNILRVLKPGGLCCIVDIDDRWTLMEPEGETFARFNDRARRGQAASGGDRYVGAKLPGYLECAGFRDARLRIAVFTSEDLPIKRLLDMAVAFKERHVLPDEREEATRELETIYSAAEGPGAWAAGSFFIATGRRSD
jgi:SAM-dependent methyltransferase